MPKCDKWNCHCGRYSHSIVGRCYAKKVEDGKAIMVGVIATCNNLFANIMVSNDVMCMGHMFICSSFGVENRTLSHIHGKLNLPMFLLRFGVVESYVNSFFDSSSSDVSTHPIILKFSTDVVWPAVFWCSYMGDGAFKFFTKGYGWLPYVFIFTVLSTTFI